MNNNELFITKCIKDSKIINLNQFEFPLSHEPSSEEDLYNTKINEENLISKIQSEYFCYTNDLQTDKIKIINANSNKNKIINFNFSIINPKNSSNLNDETKKIRIKKSKKRGRKKKRENKDDIDKIEDNNNKTHNRYSDDNLRKKCKNIILKHGLEFINKKINEKYKGNIGLGKYNKQLKILNQKGKVNSNVNADKIFIHKTLKDIFSENISSRLNNYPKTYNKSVINELLNEKDDEKRLYFNKLFSLTFLDCLKNFIDDKNKIGELSGFTRLEDIKLDLIEKHGEKYVELLIYYFENFQTLINNKKGRKVKKTDKSKAKNK